MSNKWHLIWMIPLSLILWAQIFLGIMQWDADRKCAEYEGRGRVVFPLQYCIKVYAGTEFMATWQWMLENRPE